jgi:hypothetical protein
LAFSQTNSTGKTPPKRTDSLENTNDCQPI